jgi:hypothetical protein
MDTIFLTLIQSPAEQAGAQRLVASLRRFGGELSQAPFWLFETESARGLGAKLAPLGVEIFPLVLPTTVRDYVFAGKVWACAQAETLATPAVQTLVWLDTNCLIVQPPLLFRLDSANDTALRPVHARNVGLTRESPLDDYWRGVYAALGLADLPGAVTSFVDNLTLRPYFNSHAFALLPDFSAWIGLKPLTIEGLLIIGLLLIGHGLTWEFLIDNAT